MQECVYRFLKYTPVKRGSRNTGATLLLLRLERPMAYLCAKQNDTNLERTFDHLQMTFTSEHLLYLQSNLIDWLHAILYRICRTR